MVYRCVADRKNRLRVFYEIDETERTLWVLAIGAKEGTVFSPAERL
jgi:hypothetical protein